VSGVGVVVFGHPRRRRRLRFRNWIQAASF
jgi:hypothetical protein